MKEPGKIVTRELALNSLDDITKILVALKKAIAKSQSHKLRVSKQYYFSLDNGQVPNEAGWYAINTRRYGTLYIGQAEDLDKRLNTENGSRDGFANPQRKSDPERNFLKRFAAVGLLEDLQVLTITESDFCQLYGLSSPLGKVDRDNVEKLLSIFRCSLFGNA